jgi:hypothetical protein
MSTHRLHHPRRDCCLREPVGDLAQRRVGDGGDLLLVTLRDPLAVAALPTVATPFSLTT